MKALICSGLQKGSNPRPPFLFKGCPLPVEPAWPEAASQGSLPSPSAAVCGAGRSGQAGNARQRTALVVLVWGCFFTGFWWLPHGWRWPHNLDFWWLSHTCWSDHLAADRCAFHWQDTQPAWLWRTERESSRNPLNNRGPDSMTIIIFLLSPNMVR